MGASSDPKRRPSVVPGDLCVIDLEGLGALVTALRERGYRVVGPTLRGGAIVYAELRSADELPAGYTDVQAPGRYRIERREDEARFGYAVGPQSWKRELLPPELQLWHARREPDGAFAVVDDAPEPAALAFIGVRSCELHAIGIQDRVLASGTHRDDDYAARRRDAFIVAVNCGEAGGTCFCVSMETGPKVSAGHDLALTELLDGDGHCFLVEVGSVRGGAVLAGLVTRPAEPRDGLAAERAVENAAAGMGRQLDTDGLAELLQRNREHPRWQQVADRCLTCGNCTLACPTCFCTTVEDVTDLLGDEAERRRQWDSCFNIGFSRMHGGAARASPPARYRQWMTHKLSTWWDQFGTSGCVGCGRCITWCPVGIDITEEAAAIRATDGDMQDRGDGVDSGR
jgi:sulfhydrogenase subunit beta (sulfur reductase)